MIVVTIICILVALALIGVLIHLARRDFKIDIRAKTQTAEEARVYVELAALAGAAKAEKKASEIKNASIEDKIAVSRSYAARGKVRDKRS